MWFVARSLSPPPLSVYSYSPYSHTLHWNLRYTLTTPFHWNITVIIARDFLVYSIMRATCTWRLNKPVL